VFLAGLRTIDRVRGGGWLDCPNCHEHASQDVVDQMRFAGLLGYRFSPVGRRRVLVCRRCGYRRPATEDELGHLNTGGRGIQRAWLVPIGLLPFVAIGAAALFLSTRHPPSIEDKLTFTADTVQPVAPMTLRRPLSWNASPQSDTTPPSYTVSDPTQRMVITLRRITDSGNLDQLLLLHFSDDNGINDTGVPTSPPAPTTIQIAGVTGLAIKFDYSTTGEPAQTGVIAFFHDGVGYTLTYTARGMAQFETLDQVADTVDRSLKFSATETAPPCPSPSPSPTASPSPSASPGSVLSATPAPTLPPFASSPQPCLGAVGSESPAAAPFPSTSPR
jgi:hypothetical protein